MRADRSEGRPRTAKFRTTVVARIDMAKKKAVVLGVGAERGLGAPQSPLLRRGLSRAGRRPDGSQGREGSRTPSALPAARRRRSRSTARRKRR